MTALPPAPAPASTPAHPPAAARPGVPGVPGAVRRRVWPELDLLRGLAGLAMVCNHTAVGLVPASAVALIDLPAEPLSMTPVQWTSFLGSFAPMIFFFITGVGYGLQARRGGVPRKPGLWSKAAVLLLADALLWRVGGLWIGLDFFGFIALSMVLLGLLNRLDRRTALALAAGLLGLVSVLRYGAEPIAGKLLGTEAAGWIAVFTGHRSVAGLSFPPMPWLGYPLAGFWLGAGATAFAEGLDRRRVSVAAALVCSATACVAAAAFLQTHGYPLHRWGRISPSSYAAGFAVLGVLLAGCLLAFPGPTGGGGSADRGPRGAFSLAVRGLSLRGVAAFAVVPLHFLAIAVAQGFGWFTPSAAGVFLGIGVVAALAIGAAPALSAAADRLRRSHHARSGWWAGLGLALLALGLLCVPGWEGPARSIVASVGQLALCLVLGLPVPWAARRGPGPPAATQAPGPADR